MSSVTYNGYTFGAYSHINVSAEMVEDDSQRTVVYHRYRLRVETTILAEDGDSNVGDHFLRIRQLLSKAGQNLIIDHAGFGPALDINGAGSVKDVAFGPKPRILTWAPVGNTNAVEVTWECQFTIPTCNGLTGVRYSGIAALNYGIAYRIDKFGYTTRTIAGYLEIAMTRDDRDIPDTADAYREQLSFYQPPDYERESSFQLSPDKRRLEFTITDTQIRSHNAYPPGVVNIEARHQVDWRRQAAAHLRNAISATIELSHNEPRHRAWEIFKAIVQSRVSIAQNDNNSLGAVMIESLGVNEELFGHSVSFFLTYRILTEAKSGALAKFFSSSGLFAPFTNAADWLSWKTSMRDIQSARGLSQLRHSTETDRIIDLCDETLDTGIDNPSYIPGPSLVAYQRICNPKPPPQRSYVKFESTLTSIEDVPSTHQVTIGGDDLQDRDFDPTIITAENGYTDNTKDIERFVEEAPAGLMFEWKGYAERLGYPIPKPGRITIGNKTLVRYGRALFRTKYLGDFFCQPLHGASWNMRYIVAERPEEMPPEDQDPYDYQ